MKIADRRLNDCALIIEETEGDIRLLVLNGYLKNLPLYVIGKQVKKVITESLRHIPLVRLKALAEIGLLRFADYQYKLLRSALGADGTLIALLLRFSESGEILVRRSTTPPSAIERIETQAKGIPLQEYSKDYFQNRIRPVFERLAESNALNPDSTSGTLRNLAEMEVRYKANQEHIAEFRSKGIKLVVCSVHADCSDRCYPYQGLIYSLDGTSGVTEDGKKFVPLEKATQNPHDRYITKSGRVYQNGLLGFNCRHKLYEYKTGMEIPNVSKEQQQREIAINTRQRELERIVRINKTKAQEFKNKNNKLYSHYRKLAIEANERYIKFSHNNGRAYYRDRTKVI